jgi:hypothetical protein
VNKRRRHTAKQRARAQKRIVAETQRRLRNLVPVDRDESSSHDEAVARWCGAVFASGRSTYFGPRR